VRRQFRCYLTGAGPKNRPEKAVLNKPPRGPYKWGNRPNEPVTRWGRRAKRRENAMTLNKHGLPTGTSRVMLVNNTDARLGGWIHACLIAFALENKPMPKEFDDIFKVSKFDIEADVLTGGNVQTRVIINWA
jgi:hypothetical protein